MAVYVIAVKRECRAEVGTDWLNALRDAPGVEMSGAETLRLDARRVTVHVTDNGLAELRERLGAFCHIEPVISHERLPAEGTESMPRDEIGARTSSWPPSAPSTSDEP